MRSVSFALILAGVLACNNDTNDNSPPPSPYQVTVISQNSSGGNGNPYVTAFTLEVTLKEDGSIQAGITVITQTTVGDVATLPLVTAANGRVSGTWTIQPADQQVGRTEIMAYCTPAPGHSFCDTKLNGPDRITVTF